MSTGDEGVPATSQPPVSLGGPVKASRQRTCSPRHAAFRGRRCLDPIGITSTVSGAGNIQVRALRSPRVPRIPPSHFAIALAPTPAGQPTPMPIVGSFSYQNGVGHRGAPISLGGGRKLHMAVVDEGLASVWVTDEHDHGEVLINDNMP